MTLLSFAVLALAFALIFHAVTRPASHHGLPKAIKELIMSLQSAADAMTAAASSITAASASLNDAASKIGALNDTSALDAPVAALTSAVDGLNAATASVVAAVTPQP